MIFSRKNILRRILLPTLPFWILALYLVTPALSSQPAAVIRLRYMRALTPERLKIREIAPIQTIKVVAVQNDLYLGTDDTLLRIDRFGGDTLASLKVSGLTSRCIANSETAIFACTDNGQVVRWDGGSNSAVWSTTVDEPLATGIVLHGECLLIGSRRGAVWCLSSQTGEIKWKLGVNEISRNVRTPVVRMMPLADNRLLVWRETGEILWLSFTAESYTIIGTRNVPGDSTYASSPPVQRGSRIIFPSIEADSYSTDSEFQKNTSVKTEFGRVTDFQLWDPQTASGMPLWYAADKGVVDWNETGFDTVYEDRGLGRPVAVIPVPSGNQLPSSNAESLQRARQLMGGKWILMDQKGRFWLDSQRLSGPYVGKLASNVVLLPARRLDQVDMYFVSAGGFLYRYTLPSIKAGWNSRSTSL